MAAHSERLEPDDSPAGSRPIELVTENGFSILRPWEIDGTPLPVAGKYCFQVRKPNSPERERQIAVELAENIIMEIERYSRGRIALSSSFWIACAERHLAAYLWKHDDYPPGGKLTVDRLTSEDFDQAGRWGKTGRLPI